MNIGGELVAALILLAIFAVVHVVAHTKQVRRVILSVLPVASLLALLTNHIGTSILVSAMGLLLEVAIIFWIVPGYDNNPSTPINPDGRPHPYEYHTEKDFRTATDTFEMHVAQLAQGKTIPQPGWKRFLKWLFIG